MSLESASRLIKSFPWHVAAVIVITILVVVLFGFGEYVAGGAALASAAIVGMGVSALKTEKAKSLIKRVRQKKKLNIFNLLPKSGGDQQYSDYQIDFERHRDMMPTYLTEIYDNQYKINNDLSVSLPKFNIQERVERLYPAQYKKGEKRIEDFDRAIQAVNAEMDAKYANSDNIDSEKNVRYDIKLMEHFPYDLSKCRELAIDFVTGKSIDTLKNNILIILRKNFKRKYLNEVIAALKKDIPDENERVAHAKRLLQGFVYDGMDQEDHDINIVVYIVLLMVYQEVIPDNREEVDTKSGKLNNDELNLIIKTALTMEYDIRYNVFALSPDTISHILNDSRSHLHINMLINHEDMSYLKNIYMLIDYLQGYNPIKELPLINNEEDVKLINLLITLTKRAYSNDRIDVSKLSGVMKLKLNYLESRLKSIIEYLPTYHRESKMLRGLLGEIVHMSAYFATFWKSLKPAMKDLYDADFGTFNIDPVIYIEGADESNRLLELGERNYDEKDTQEAETDNKVLLNRFVYLSKRPEMNVEFKTYLSQFTIPESIESIFNELFQR